MSILEPGNHTLIGEELDNGRIGLTCDSCDLNTTATDQRFVEAIQIRHRMVKSSGKG